MGSRISLFQTISVAFLIAALIFLILAAVLFFVFDVRSVWGILTGRAAKKTILEMEKKNAETGRLISYGPPSDARKLEDVISYPTTGEITQRSESVKRQETAVLQEYAGGSEAAGENETTVLGGGGETSLLAAGPDQSFGRFLLLKNEIVIHTLEVVT